MTVEWSPSDEYEYYEDDICERLGQFAPAIQKDLCYSRSHFHYLANLNHTLQRTDSMRAMATILPLLGDPELIQYTRLKRTHGITGSLIAIEAARQAIGEGWDEELANTLIDLASDLELESDSPTNEDLEFQQANFLDRCDEGWAYGKAYHPIIDVLALSDSVSCTTHEQLNEIQNALGFVFYATSIVMRNRQIVQTHELEILLNLDIKETIEDIEFKEQAYQFRKNPALWDIAIEEFFKSR